VTDEIDMPNGIALSPDETTLYVTDSESHELFSMSVAADGTASAPTKMLDSGQTPDGMAVDDDGNLYLTTQAGVQVYTAAGMLIGTIDVPEIPANCTFGGPDRKTLYITARTGLYRVETNVAGLP
jgi:gluconolactonase